MEIWRARSGEYFQLPPRRYRSQLLKTFRQHQKLAMALELAMVVRGEDGICLEFSGEQAAGQGYASENADVSNADPLLWQLQSLPYDPSGGWRPGARFDHRINVGSVD
jgi:hypothetical protein